MIETEQRIDTKLEILESERSKIKKDKERQNLYCDRAGMEIEDRLSHLMKGEAKLNIEREDMNRIRADILKQKQVWAEAFETKEREMIRSTEEQT